MLVRMRTTLAGPEHNCPAGQTIVLPDNFAGGLISTGFAEKVENPASPKAETPVPTAKAEPEAASLKTPETAVEKPAKFRSYKKK